MHLMRDHQNIWDKSDRSKERNSSIISGDFSTPQKEIRQTEDINNTIIQQDLTHVYRTLYPTKADIFSKYNWVIFQDGSHARPQVKFQ